MTSVDLPELEPGDYPFACGMNMVHGTLRVSGKSTNRENTDAAAEEDTNAAKEGTGTDTRKSTDTTAGKSNSTNNISSINNADSTNTVHTPETHSTRSPIDQQNTEEEERIQEIRELKRLILIGAILTTPVFIVSMAGMVVPGMPVWLMDPWWQAALITPVMFYCGWPIHRIGWLAIAHRSPDMNSLVTAGSFAAYIYSLAVCIAPQILPPQSRTAYFESVGVVITLVLVGRFLEAKAPPQAAPQLPSPAAVKHIPDRKPAKVPKPAQAAERSRSLMPIQSEPATCSSSKAEIPSQMTGSSWPVKAILTNL